MLNSCVVNPKVGPLSCDCSDAPRHQASKTPVRGLVRSVPSLQHEICVLQATTERCGNLATRLRVGQLCSTIQLPSLSGWPRRSTDEASDDTEYTCYISTCRMLCRQNIIIIVTTTVNLRTKNTLEMGHCPL